MQQDEETIRQALRAHGLRSTPQRHAILKAFAPGAGEHLSAEDIHDRASRSMTSLSRGTVYATLAEFTELGLLGAFGAPEPVRYELNTSAHDHFRCRVCRRLFDIGRVTRRPAAIAGAGFTVERVETHAEGICRECGDYASGLADGVQTINQTAFSEDLLALRGIAAAQMDSPLGKLLLVATSAGLVRVAFEDHADAAALAALAASRRGAVASRGHLEATLRELRRYIAGENATIEAPVDWATLAAAHPGALRATREIPYATTRSYVDIPLELAPGELAWSLGANPLPLLMPCHRVTRGLEVPDVFVGGPARRDWLLAHERTHDVAA